MSNACWGLLWFWMYICVSLCNCLEACEYCCVAHSRRMVGLVNCDQYSEKWVKWQEIVFISVAYKIFGARISRLDLNEMWKTGGWIAWFYSMMLTLFVTAVLRKGDRVGKDANQIDRKSSTTEVVVCSSGKWHILLPLLLAIFFLVNHACIWLAGDVLFCVKKFLYCQCHGWVTQTL